MTQCIDNTRQTMAIIQLIGFVFTLGVAQMMFTSLALAASLQSKSVAVNNHQGVKLMITVPVRLLTLDSRVGFGKIECIVIPTYASRRSDRLGCRRDYRAVELSENVS